MYFPKPINPNPTCIKPAKRKTVKIAGNAEEISPSKLATIPAMTTILTAVIGAVGPEIWVLIPPKRAAKKLIKIAPCSFDANGE